eukprot:scaffold5287_cov345-Prasinococcus_capsulatus_cf.AAC.8
MPEGRGSATAGRRSSGRKSRWHPAYAAAQQVAGDKPRRRRGKKSGKRPQPMASKTGTPCMLSTLPTNSATASRLRLRSSTLMLETWLRVSDASDAKPSTPTSSASAGSGSRSGAAMTAQPTPST